MRSILYKSHLHIQKLLLKFPSIMGEWYWCVYRLTMNSVDGQYTYCHTATYRLSAAMGGGWRCQEETDCHLSVLAITSYFDHWYAVAYANQALGEFLWLYWYVLGRRMEHCLRDAELRIEYTIVGTGGEIRRIKDDSNTAIASLWIILRCTVMTKFELENYEWYVMFIFS